MRWSSIETNIDLNYENCKFLLGDQDDKVTATEAAGATATGWWLSRWFQDASSRLMNALGKQWIDAVTEWTRCLTGIRRIFLEAKYTSLYITMKDVDVLFMEDGKPKSRGLNNVKLEKIAVYFHDFFEYPKQGRMPSHFFRAPITPIIWVHL